MTSGILYSLPFIGLGWATLQRQDWSAARRHFATAIAVICDNWGNFFASAMIY